MNSRQLLIAAVVLVVLVLLGIHAVRRHDSGWTVSPEAVRTEMLPELDVNRVARIALAVNDQTTVLARSDEGWKVESLSNYPADFDKISGGLVELSRLRVAQHIKAGPSQYGRLQLEKPGQGSNAGLFLELFDAANERLAGVLLGKEHFPKEENPAAAMFGGTEPDGRFLRLDSEGQAPVLVSQTLGMFSPKPEDWMDKSFIRPEKVRSISLQTLYPENDWIIERETEAGSFVLRDIPDGKEVEAMKIDSITSGIRYLSFQSPLPSSTPDEKTGLDQADTLIIKTFEEFTYVLQIASKDKKCYLRIHEVSCILDGERKAAENEVAEDKERLDREFSENRARLKGKMEKEKSFEKWLYEVPNAKYETLVIPKADLVKDKKVEEKKSSDPNAEPVK
jgi:hypothetical protein